MARERIISPKEQTTDVEPSVIESSTHSIRPTTLEQYLGQAELRERLSVALEAAKDRDDPMEHVLLYGPPGLGKTTLAHVIANELGTRAWVTSGPALTKGSDLVGTLTRMEPGDVLFIDEIHRLPAAVEEYIYPAMEDYYLDIIIGEGPSARSIKLDLSAFTLVGATTRAGLLTSPLRDRFGIVQRLSFYSVNELTQIIRRSAQILGVSIEPQGAVEIARRARGTPRIANRLLRRVRDYAQVKSTGTITEALADSALNLLQVDTCGFDAIDRQFLLTIIEKFSGGPVGVESLAAAIGEERNTIEDVVEPFLIQQGFLARTLRGRVATPAAYTHFGLCDEKTLD